MDKTPYIVLVKDVDGIIQYVKRHQKLRFGDFNEDTFEFTTDQSQAKQFEGTSTPHYIVSNYPEFKYKKA